MLPTQYAIESKTPQQLKKGVQPQKGYCDSRYAIVSKTPQQLKKRCAAPKRPKI